MCRQRILECNNCYFFKNANIGGTMYIWCFNSNNHGIISDINKALDCNQYSEFIYDLNLEPDSITRNQKKQRKNKIKKKCEVFRFHYSLDNKAASIISRFDHWILMLSDNKEYLFHQNVRKSNEYKNVKLVEIPEFHLHKVLENTPMAIQRIFEEIEKHDIHVLKNRYHASIRGR